METSKLVVYIVFVLSCIGVVFSLGGVLCLVPLCQCCNLNRWEARKSFKKFWIVKALLLCFAALWIGCNVLDLQLILWDGEEDAFLDVRVDDMRLMCRLYILVGIGISLPMFVWLSYLALRSCQQHFQVHSLNCCMQSENARIVIKATLYTLPVAGVMFLGAWLETDLDSKTHIFNRDEKSRVNCSDWSNSIIVSIGLAVFVGMMVVNFLKATLSISRMVINQDYRRRLWCLYVSIATSLILYAAAVVTQFSIVDVDALRNTFSIVRVVAQLVTVFAVAIAMVVMPSISSCRADRQFVVQDTEMQLLMSQQEREITTSQQ
eukprot:TRINITY_DN10279_c0_g2_i1.p2 TRINITY_DN10279_c0_g2~~TRINITY_DN10279_c0_g2_i1.p2  ORF type:complete len:320 (-),score=34.55 TRINITY_DN10279_c0_g2_i1:438-1397(-)